MKKAPAKQATPFHKLHGAGNDIIVLEGKRLPKKAKPQYLRQLAHRQLGLGCDQFVEILSLRPLAVQIWNADGSKAEMCANGARVFLYLAAAKKWINPKAKAVPIKISGKLYEGLKSRTGYELSLGEPKIEPVEILELTGERIPFWPVNVGNPHAVISLVEDGHYWSPPEQFSFKEFGARIERHVRFPHRTNVEFIREISAKGKEIHAVVDVWERGAGATLSCGSGAVAVATVLRKLTGGELFQIIMSGFKLSVRFEGGRAFLSGPSALVASGFYYS